jgi:hypothetical protein
MSLASEVTARFDPQTLAELTNPRAPGTSSVDATKLSKACTSAEAAFKVYAGKVFDETDVRHVDVAAEFVVAFLFKWGASNGATASARWNEAVEMAHALARVTSRDRMVPRSSSELTPSPESTGLDPVRPDFDRSRIGGLVPRMPSDQRSASFNVDQ